MYIANLMDGSVLEVQAEDLAQAMGILNEDFPELKHDVISWLGPTGITFQMHDRKMVSYR